MFTTVDTRKLLRLKYKYIVLCWDCNVELKAINAQWAGPKAYCYTCASIRNRQAKEEKRERDRAIQRERETIQTTKEYPAGVAEMFVR